MLARARTAVANVWRILFIRVIVIFIVCWAVFGLAYGYLAARTVIVEARTSAFQILLKEDLDPLTLGPYHLCLPREAPNPRETGKTRYGCSPSLYTITEFNEPSLFFSSGTLLEFRINAERFEIEVVATPTDWSLKEHGYGKNAIFSVDADRLSELGQLAATGTVSIGAQGTSSKGAVHSGRYEIYGKPLTGFIPRGRSVLLNEATIPAGAFVTLVRALSGKDATAHIQLTAPTDSARTLALLAISETAPVDLKLELFQTDPILLRPSFADAFQNDPVLIVLLTLLGALATAIELSKKKSRGG